MTKRQRLMAAAALVATTLAAAPAGLAAQRAAAPAKATGPAASETQAAQTVAPRAGRTMVGRSQSLKKQASDETKRPCRRGLGHHPALACRARAKAGNPQQDSELAQINTP